MKKKSSPEPEAPVARGPETRSVPLELLVPNEKNSNVMPPDLTAKLAAHIRQTGLYPPLIVRPHPSVGGRFQILDGHHRFDVLRWLGHAAANCAVWNVSDRQAMVLLATLNRLQGQDRPALRAQLIHELLGEFSAEDLAGLLPESVAQIEELEALLQFPADEVAALLDEQATAEDATLPVVLTFVVTPEQAEIIERAVESASDGEKGRDRRARGLTAVARAFRAPEA